MSSIVGNNSGNFGIMPEPDILRVKVKNNQPPRIKEVQETGKVPDKKAETNEERNASSGSQTDAVGSKNDGSDKNVSVPETKLNASTANLGFVYDGEVKKAIMRVVDEETKEVVLQVPPEEEILKIRESMKKDTDGLSAGVIVDKKV